MRRSQKRSRKVHVTRVCVFNILWFTVIYRGILVLSSILGLFYVLFVCLFVCLQPL